MPYGEVETNLRDLMEDAADTLGFDPETAKLDMVVVDDRESASVRLVLEGERK